MSSWENLFLAGSIEQGKAVDWQADAVSYFNNFNVNVYNPRRQQWNPELEQSIREPKFVSQVAWEQKYLERADYILFNLLPDTKSPISLHELGQLCGVSDKTVVVCCPKGFWRRGNVQISCILSRFFLYEEFEDALAHIRVLLEYKQI